MRTSWCYRSLLQGTAGLIIGACISGAAVAADIAPMPTKAPVAPAPGSQSVDLQCHIVWLGPVAERVDDG